MDKFSNNNKAITDFKNDAKRLSIKNNSNENNNALTNEENDISAVRNGRTEDKNKTELAGDFLLARESVVRFMQDFIADAVDRRNKTLTKMEKQTSIYLM